MTNQDEMRTEELLEKMERSHAERFNERFWAFFDAHAATRLPPKPAMVDFGSGPGLFLRDLSSRYLDATLLGFDGDPAMVKSAAHLAYPGPTPEFQVLDLDTGHLPLPDSSVHLAHAALVLYRLEDPIAFLQELRRVLAPEGVFLLYDRARTPLERFVARYRQRGLEETVAVRKHWNLFFWRQNKYADEDWRWLMEQAGLSVAEATQPEQNNAWVWLVLPA